VIDERRFERSLTNALRRERIQLGLTQPQLAWACSSTRRAIGNLERGYDRPRTQLCFKMASSMGLCLGDLLRSAAAAAIE
jgi:DNA-binding XRE family transcriptional regulator